MKFSSDFSYRIKSCGQKLSICPDLKPNQLSPSLRRKIIMRIQLIFLIAFTAMLQVSASGFAQKININQTNISLEKALKLIREQSGYDVLYDSKVIKKPTTVVLNVKNGTVVDALKQCLTGTGFTYRIEENTILIKEKTYVEEVLELISHQFQVNVIRGTVWTKKNNISLAGATIMVKRTKKAVYADTYGRFTISDTRPSDTLVCSYIGYVTQDVPVGKQTEFMITLEETTNVLDAVVVQAYGRTTQRLTTGNIVRVTASDISKQLAVNPLLALQGLVPGLEITRSNGNDMSVPKVELRGRSSINSNFSGAPLYIVDGVPLTVLGSNNNGSGRETQSYISPGMDQGSLSNAGGISPLYSINPADIESIEVLKDADATAIYGSRGGNGVILITTKKGKPGKTDFSVSGKQGLKRVVQRWDLLNTAQYLDMRRQAFANDGLTPTTINAPELFRYDPNRYTDWQDYLYGYSGQYTDFQVGLSGGDRQTSFRISSAVNRVKDVAVMAGANQRVSASSNLSHKSLDNRFSMNFSNSFASFLNNASSLGNIAILPPNGPEAYDEKGKLNFSEWQDNMFEFSQSQSGSKGSGTSLTSSLNLGYSLLKNLSVKVNLGYNSMLSDQRFTIPLSSYNLAANPNAQSSISSANTNIKNFLIEPQMEYNNFIGKGKLNALLGATYQSTSTKLMRVSARGFASDEQLQSINSATTFDNTESALFHKYLGVFARLNYNWEDKYILNLNGRRDGSSRFGPANRFGNFGSIGAAWIASEEPWVKNNLPQFISLLKFRGSYGVTGSDGIGDYQYLTQWGSNGSGSKLLPYEGANPVVPQIQPNDDFHWQQNKKSEVALGLAFFKDMMNLDISLYRDYSNNQLLSFPTPGYTGFTSVVLNSPAEVENSGIELSFSARILDTKNFSWQAGFNFSINKNLLVGYPQFEESPYYSAYKIGQSLNNTYVFHFTGVDPQTGENTFQDVNGDGKILYVANIPSGTGTDDRLVAINTSPDFFGGMSQSFRYKNVSLTAGFTYFKQRGIERIGPSGNKNRSLYEYENTWKNPGDQALFPKLTTLNKTSNNNYATSDAAYVDASFIRLQSIQLGYVLPVNKLRSIGISNLSVNVTGDNIFVLTHYKGLDPEVRQFGGQPLTRTITIGLNCTF
ncbi:SusC/RagA family TonB-linked outer membrane protein [Pedobacter sp. N36a]|uniref:SusC/RagA family TonB-linked outer membrane protein n=1 Tax=Pedobacter sp. N36a TaxID=2767996 RepID=UPI0016575E17|nr:SusC/RagA family TonB-linked outer membrane protein [Pedobacter sp. N36a]MBC8988222.1 SusC/RagA family TonB-linked outer membrane protein [Pedobacter sp. N36a]